MHTIHDYRETLAGKRGLLSSPSQVDTSSACQTCMDAQAHACSDSFHKDSLEGSCIVLSVEKTQDILLLVQLYSTSLL